MKRRARRPTRARGRAGWALGLALGASAVAAASLCASCRSRDAAAPGETPEAALHGVHDEHLRAVMAELQELALARLPQEIDVLAEERGHAAEIARIARDMASSADAIPSVLEDVVLDPDQRAGFEQLALRLREQADELHVLAPTLSVAQLSERLDGIAATCAACHEGYRILPRVER